MKKLLFLFIITLFCLTGCVYVGLLPSETKKHNDKIIEQISSFPIEHYSGCFYEEKQTIYFTSKNAQVEYFIVQEDVLYYYNGSIERSYKPVDKEEIIEEKSNVKYEPFQKDIEDILGFTKSFNGSSDKCSGRRGMEQVEEDILDEVTHYFYNMDWKYSPNAMLDFYVSSKTSELYFYGIRDISNDGGQGLLHFNLSVYKDSTMVASNLSEEYEFYKRSFELEETSALGEEL